ncbi:MAG: MATE family efflux transporter [Chitinophagaceae bacterium]|nr:MATE family efflux transporter [Chitinophagaceae bacterium]
METQIQDIKVQNTYRNIIKLALPVGISILIPQLSILTNTLFLGNYIPKEVHFSTQDFLAASGIAGIYYLTLVMVGYGLVSGMLMLMSRKAGEGNPEGVGQIFSSGVKLCFMLAAVLMSISFFLAPWLFNHLIHAPHIRDAATSFVKMRFWGLPFIMLCQLANSLFLATSHSRKIILGSTVQTLVNIVLDYFLIFGIGFFPEMGLNGTALASVVSEMAYLAVVLWQILKSGAFQSFAIRFFAPPDWGLMKHIFLKSLPLIFQYLFSIGAWEFFFLYVEHIGKAESAVSQILRSVFGIVGVATWALASTCNSMVSNLIGQGAIDEVKPVIRKILTVSFSFTVLAGLWMLISPVSFLSLMTSDLVLIETGRISLRIVIFATWMLSISTICFSAVVGTGKTVVNLVFEFVAIILYICYTYSVVEIFHLSLPYAWASEFVYWLSLFIMSGLYLYSNRWKPAKAESE